MAAAEHQRLARGEGFFHGKPGRQTRAILPWDVGALGSPDLTVCQPVVDSKSTQIDPDWVKARPAVLGQ